MRMLAFPTEGFKWFNKDGQGFHLPFKLRYGELLYKIFRWEDHGKENLCH
jgi:hypothetical protein